MSTHLDRLVGMHIDAALLHDGCIYLLGAAACVEHEDCLACPAMGRECAARAGRAASGFSLSPEGDCCASAFVQGVSIAYALRDAVVTKVEDIETTNVEGGGEVTDAWGHRIHTTKGVCTLDCRTEHNGYYSGWLNVLPVTEAPASARVLEDFS